MGSFLFYKYYIGDDFMNTTGFLRGYMSKNMNSERFIEVVREALSREFEEEVKLEKIDNEFKITMGNYNTTKSKELIEHNKGAYSIFSKRKLTQNTIV